MKLGLGDNSSNRWRALSSKEPIPGIARCISSRSPIQHRFDPPSWLERVKAFRPIFQPF